MKKFICITLMFFVASCDAIWSDRAASNFFDDKEVVALANAAAKGDTEKIDSLLADGVDINYVGEEGFTPLYWLMVAKKNPDVVGVEHLVQNGADPLRFHEPSGQTALSISAQHPDAAYLRIFLEAGADPNFLHPGDSARPVALFHAVTQINFKHIKLLLDYGADTEIKNRNCDTPLLRAAELNWQATYILLENGADYNARTCRGNGFTIVWVIENFVYYPQEDGSVDWRQKVVDFLRAEGVEVNPWMPEDEKTAP